MKPTGPTPAVTFRLNADTLMMLDALCKSMEEKVGLTVSRSSWVRQMIHREYARSKAK